MNKTIPKTLPLPCLARRKYRNEWEYCIIHSNHTYTPFGPQSPRGIKWVYQVTWKNKIQRIAVLKPIDWVDADQERACWWKQSYGKDALPLIKIHSKDRK